MISQLEIIFGPSNIKRVETLKLERLRKRFGGEYIKEPAIYTDKRDGTIYCHTVFEGRIRSELNKQTGG